MSQNTICWTDIPVLEMHRAIAFYSAVLNQPVGHHKFDDWEYGLLPMDKNSASGCLAPADEDNQPSRIGPLIYLSVNGRLDDAVEIAGSKGGHVLRPKHQIGPYGYRAIIIDSEGNRIALHSETA